MKKKTNIPVQNKELTAEEIVLQIRRKMPERLRSALHQIRRDYDQLAWKIARKTSELYAFAIHLDIGATIFHSCTAAQEELDIDISAFRIYDYYLVWQCINNDEEITEQANLLPFTHLLFARQHSCSPSPKYTFREILEIDLDLMDNNQGIPVSLNRLKAKILSNGDANAYHSTRGRIAVDLQSGELLASPSSTISVVKGIFEHVESIEAGLLHLEKLAEAGNKRLIRDAIKALSSGAMITRQVVTLLVEDNSVVSSR